jgi:hypothetical protein
MSYEAITVEIKLACRMPHATCVYGYEENDTCESTLHASEFVAEVCLFNMA